MLFFVENMITMIWYVLWYPGVIGCTLDMYATNEWNEIAYRLAKMLHNKPQICQGGTSFVDLLCFCSVLCLLCLCARLFICALWSPAEKGLASWLSFVVSNREFETFPLVSWVGCGA